MGTPIPGITPRYPVKDIVATLGGGISAATIYQKIAAGLIPCVRAEGRVLVTREAVEAYLAERTYGSDPAATTVSARDRRVVAFPARRRTATPKH